MRTYDPSHPSTTIARTTAAAFATIALCAAPVLAPASAHASEQDNESAESATRDASITASVKAQLTADPQVNPVEIDVDTIDGVVRLSGWVETDVEREAAVRIAEGTDGVREVEDEINMGDPSVGENLTDAAILTAIKTKLTTDPDVNPFPIDVDVSRGTVTLSGKVKSDAQAEEAERLAVNTRGVKHVDNRLEISESN